ncbi:hypothetical protein LTR66_002148 [Elasticomyces elasticus]|nr:hypothetical protein LTR66_002148 [Elasticomyces elasticus]
MPWEESPAMNCDIDTWRTFFGECFWWHKWPNETTSELQELRKKSKTSGRSIADILIRYPEKYQAFVDPLRPLYVEELLRLHIIDSADVLILLLKHSQYLPKTVEGMRTGAVTWIAYQDKYAAEMEEACFTVLARQLTRGERPKGYCECDNLVSAFTQWFQALIDYSETGSQALESLASQPYLLTCDYMGTLAITLLGNTRMQDYFRTPGQKNGPFRNVLNNFLPLLTQFGPSQISAQLRTYANSYSLADVRADGTMVFSEQQIQEAVADVPAVSTRAGFYVYLNALLLASPFTDDQTILNYLYARSSCDIQAMAVDLVVGSLDVLANARSRNESVQSIALAHAYLVNKVPILLLAMAPSIFAPLTIDFCIQQAVSRATNPYALSPSSTSRQTVPDAFLRACVLHQLLTEASAQTLNGGQPIAALPRGGKYIKEQLILQCATNSQRIEDLIAEIESTQGNAGAITGCVVEVLQNLCAAKETMSLRNICNALSRRPKTLDCIFLFTSPVALLQPLCQILDTWTHDEDQSEFQPPYEEFAAILLLVFTVKHRYAIKNAEIGLSGNSSFMATLLDDFATSKSMDQLTEVERANLGKWVQGLYATDEQGETVGINDDTMSHCNPQDFYRLVPTLFEQSVLACRTGVLTTKILKGGLEFLVEPFLLPSLIGGLCWLIKHLYEDHQDLDVLIQILHMLISPTSMSGDAQAMHNTIVAIVLKPLQQSLGDVQRRQPGRQDVAQILSSLEPHMSNSHLIFSPKTELDQWSVAHEGGICQAVRDALRQLLAWSTTTGTTPTNYTHRLLTTAVRLEGAHKVLEAVAEEIALQTEENNASAAVDIAANLLCAPTPEHAPYHTAYNMALDDRRGKRLSLRDALKHVTADSTKLLERETLQAEALIRLNRKVDTLLTGPSMPLAMPLDNLRDDSLVQDINLGGAKMPAVSLTLDPANAIRPETVAEFAAAMDQSMAMVDMSGMTGLTETGPLSLDQGGSFFAPNNELSLALDAAATTRAGTLMEFAPVTDDAALQSMEDDIFAGIDFDEDMSFN